ncbi:MAG: hypothetical protein DSZ03_05335 [Sulfurimonas sp.]|nr:MAG: hypothetical protein DSZ03_05335 [Sulfurimonas sp.]
MALFIVLQNGIVIDSVDISSVKAEELYIKWNEKLLVKVDKLEISTHPADPAPSFDVMLLENLLKNTKIFLTLFEGIELSHIHINEIEGSFEYVGKRGMLTAHSPQWSLSSRLAFQNNRLHMIITSFQNQQYDADINGTLTLHMDRKLIEASLQCRIADDADLAIAATATTKAVSFHIHSQHPIKNLRRVVKKFDLDPTIMLWAINNISASEYTLEYLRGVYEFNHPDTLLETLEAKAYLPKMHYTFAPNLAPIVTEYTQLHFNKGILHIRPHNGSYMHHLLPKSYLDIDFSQPEFYLSTHIITDTILDEAILEILTTYGINLPLRQTRGITQSNLNLTINLHTLDTTAKGTFGVDNGSFLFKGEHLHVKNLLLKLTDTHVDITQGSIAYKEMIDADIQGYLDPAKHRARLLITPKYIALNNAALDPSKQLVQATYELNAKKETLALSHSQWLVGNNLVYVDAFEAPFRFEHFSIMLPNIGFTLKDTVQGSISGDINASQHSADVNLTLKSVQYPQLLLKDANYTINFHYNNDLTITTEAFGHFQYHKQHIKVAPLKLRYTDHRLNIEASKFYIQDLVNFQLQGSYKTQKQEGTFQLGYINTFPQELYSANNALNIHYKNVNGNHLFTAAQLHISALVSSQGWWINIPDISNIARHSTLLKHAAITEGNITICGTDANETVTFSGKLRFPYAILVEDETFQHHYRFEGSHRPNHTQLHINNALHVNIADTVTINAADVGFNIPELVKFFEHQHESNSSNRYLVLNATNSFLYLSKRRRAPIDEMHLYYDGGTVYATLEHAQGNAQFELDESNNFYLYGDNFNDHFMNSLLALAEHQKGSLYFYISGKPEQFQGVLRVNNTILKDYKVINNMLAFVNTLPALTTFSLPQYSSKGLRVTEAYAGFTYEHKNITVHDISIHSKELRIQGNGELNFDTNRIDMQLALKTDLGSTLSKVPIVGYLLFGDDGSVSTTLTLTGRLDDPTITNAVAKDIIVAPFQLLKRTILLPAHLIEQVQ